MVPGEVASLRDLAAQLEVGDVVFIRVRARPFREVARATGSWTNHVGVVIDRDGKEAIVAESRFPLSRLTPFSLFAGRSAHGRMAVSRLTNPLTAEQRERLRCAAHRRLNVIYDTGLNVRSRRQFCSRYVCEVVGEATGLTIGEVETFESLLRRRPNADLRFWKPWYFGRIPWTRETVSPASVLRSPNLETVFDGIVTHDCRRKWRSARS